MFLRIIPLLLVTSMVVRAKPIPVDEYTTTTSVSDVSETGGNDGWAILTSAVAAVIHNCQYSWYINDSLIIQGDGSSCLKPINTFITYLQAHTAPLLPCNGCAVNQSTVNQPELMGCTDSDAYNALATG